jgi:hypothetical protein
MLSKVGRSSMYAPRIRSARRVREHTIDGEHDAVLLTNIEAAGVVRYAFLLVVFRRGVPDPVAFVSSKVEQKLGLEGHDADFGEGGGAHFLGAFVKDGHRNDGASDKWADEAKFEASAIALAKTLVAESA